MTENKRTNNPEGVRRRIVDTAFDAFVSQGYLATGMLELRERAAVSGARWPIISRPNATSGLRLSATV